MCILKMKTRVHLVASNILRIDIALFIERMTLLQAMYYFFKSPPCRLNYRPTHCKKVFFLVAVLINGSLHYSFWISFYCTMENCNIRELYMTIVMQTDTIDIGKEILLKDKFFQNVIESRKMYKICLL